MAAGEHLSQTQFFHVSPEAFKPGDLVEPGHPRPDGSPSTHVYASTTRGRAKYWAQGRAQAGEPTDVYTYKVEPTGDFEHDPEGAHSGGSPEDLRTQAPLRIVRRLPGSTRRPGH